MNQYRKTQIAQAIKCEACPDQNKCDLANCMFSFCPKFSPFVQSYEDKLQSLSDDVMDLLFTFRKN